MKNINELVGPKTNLSLVITDGSVATANKVWAFLLPSHLIGNDFTRSGMNPGRFIPADRKDWYPIVVGDDAGDALQKLDAKIESTLGGYHLHESRFAAIVWNTATALVEKGCPVWNMDDLRQLHDVSVLTNDEPPTPPGATT